MTGKVGSLSTVPRVFAHHSTVIFKDESREIASEYKGGLARYARIHQTITPPGESSLEYPPRSMILDPLMDTENNALPPIQSTGPYSENSLAMVKQETNHSKRHH